MWDKIKAKLKTWFKDSETIFWARLQMLVGALGAIVTSLMQSPDINAAIQAVLKPEYVPYYVIGFGVITEIARRLRATDL